MRFIRQRFRRLNQDRAYAFAKRISTPVILMLGVALIACRNYKHCSPLVALCLLKILRPDVELLPAARKIEDLELERYALQLERGDFGKVEVIPFR